MPKGWEWCKLDDLAFYKKGPFGSSLTKSMFVPESPSAYKVYEQKNAINKDCSLGHYFIDAEKYEELKGFAVSPNDIIVSCAGTIGETYVLPDNIRAGIINQALMIIRLYDTCITDFYLLYFDFILKNEAAKESKGTAIKNIPPFDILKNFLIPIPPLSEQIRIIEEVNKWLNVVQQIDDSGEDIGNLISKTKSKILDLAIHGKLVPHDPNDEPAIELLKRINPSFVPCDNAHYGNMPVGWQLIELGKVCQLTEGEPKENAELPYLDVKAMRTGLLAHKSSGKYVEAGTMLILVDGENSGEVFKTETAGYQGSTMKVLNIDKNMNEEYVIQFIRLFKKALKENKVGSAIPHLNKKMFRELVIPIPPQNEQARIVSAIQQYEIILDSISANL